mgnify:CR=1 FL=1
MEYKYLIKLVRDEINALTCKAVDDQLIKNQKGIDHITENIEVRKELP